MNAANQALAMDRETYLACAVRDAALAVEGVSIASGSHARALPESKDRREVLTVTYGGDATGAEVLAAIEERLPSRYGYKHVVIKRTRKAPSFVEFSDKIVAQSK